MQTQTYIYGLADPRFVGGTVWYVGKANDPEKRLREHLIEARTFVEKGNTLKLGNYMGIIYLTIYRRRDTL
jgi:predicted GIY-YIG superfamily endonuclease